MEEGIPVENIKKGFGWEVNDRNANFIKVSLKVFEYAQRNFPVVKSLHVLINLCFQVSRYQMFLFKVTNIFERTVLSTNQVLI